MSIFLTPSLFAKPQQVMGGLWYAPIASLVSELQYNFGIKTCVETGTFHGKSTCWAAEVFKEVISIEIDKDRLETAKENCKPYHNIWFYYGDSVIALPFIVRELYETSFFWLDAHLVAKRGEELPEFLSPPLLEELEIIINDRFQHYILIDDAHAFDISTIKTMAEKHDYKMGVAYDTIAFVPPIAEEIIVRHGWKMV